MKEMSFREEIYDWIVTYTSAQGSYREQYTNSILKLIEKRIDELKIKKKDYENKFNDDWISGFRAGLIMLKTELS